MFLWDYIWALIRLLELKLKCMDISDVIDVTLAIFLASFILLYAILFKKSNISSG